MTKHELIKLFKGLRKGTRPITDIYADWPTKIFIKYLGYPGHIENSMGIPISPKVVEKIEATYPNIQVYIVSDSPEKVMARLKVHVKAGHKIFVPIIEEDKEGFGKEPVTKPKTSWGIKTSYTHETSDEYIDDDGTRMIKINGPDKDGKTIYEGYSDKHLTEHPDAYEKLINGSGSAESVERPVSHMPWNGSVIKRAESEPVETHCMRLGPEREATSTPNIIVNKQNYLLRHVSSLIKEIPEYLLPPRDPNQWEILPNPHHPGLFIWDEIPQEPPPRKYNMRW